MDNLCDLLSKTDKVMSALLGFLTIIITILFIGASSWAHYGRQRMGLWDACMDTGPDWILVCRGLCILALALCITASVIVCVGLHCDKFSSRYRNYCVAILVFFLGAMFDATALTIYLIKFSESFVQFAEGNFSVGWAYYLGWGATGMMLFSAFLLCIDKNTDEIIVRETTTYKNEKEEEKLTHTEEFQSEVETDVAYADGI